MMKKNINLIMLLIAVIDIITICLIYKVIEYNNPVRAEKLILTMNSSVGNYVPKDEYMIRKENLENESEIQVENSMEEIFSEYIIGEYVVNDRISYKFDENGRFSGFFDAEETNVHDYFYEIMVIDDIPYLNIYNKERTKLVIYELSITDEMNIVLYYEKNNLKIELKK